MSYPALCMTRWEGLQKFFKPPRSQPLRSSLRRSTLESDNATQASSMHEDPEQTRKRPSRLQDDRSRTPARTHSASAVPPTPPAAKQHGRPSQSRSQYPARCGPRTTASSSPRAYTPRCSAPCRVWVERCFEVDDILLAQGRKAISVADGVAV